MGNDVDDRQAPNKNVIMGFSYISYLNKFKIHIIIFLDDSLQKLSNYSENYTKKQSCQNQLAFSQSLPLNFNELNKLDVYIFDKLDIFPEMNKKALSATIT